MRRTQRREETLTSDEEEEEEGDWAQREGTALSCAYYGGECAGERPPGAARLIKGAVGEADPGRPLVRWRGAGRVVVVIRLVDAHRLRVTSGGGVDDKWENRRAEEGGMITPRTREAASHQPRSSSSRSSAPPS